LLKKALQTNPRDASPAVTREKMAALFREKCLLPLAHPAAMKQRFLSSREMIALFIAAIVFPDRDNSACNKRRDDAPVRVYHFLLYYFLATFS